MRRRKSIGSTSHIAKAYNHKIGTRVVSVRVGTEPNRQDFTVHEDLLCRSSSFFNAALKKDWQEAQDRLVSLPTQRPESFYVYVQWLYSARLFSKHTLSQTDSSSDTNRQEWGTLVGCYLLATYVQDVSFKDTIMDAMMQWAVDVPQTARNVAIESANDIYDNTEEESPLRKFLVDLSIWKVGAAAWERENTLELPFVFMRAVIAGLWRHVDSGRTLRDAIDENKGTCHYHAHGSKPCHNRSTYSERPRTWSSMAGPARGYFPPTLCNANN